MPDGPSTNWDEIELSQPLIDEFAAIVLDAMRKLYATNYGQQELERWLAEHEQHSGSV